MLTNFDNWERPANNGAINFYCSDFQIKNDRYEFLINVSNSTLSDPVFSGKQNRRKTRRIIQKNVTLNEGLDFSSHVIIQLPSSDINDLNEALILIECIDGLHINNIIKFFNYCLKKVQNSNLSEFQQLDPSGGIDASGNPLVINVDYKLEHRINPTPDIIAMINSSSVKNLILIDDRTINTPLDERGYFTESEKSLNVSVSEQLNKSLNKWQSIKNFIFRQKRDYQHARIILRQDENKPIKKIDVETSGDFTNAISQSFYIKTSVDLLSSYEKFCEPILIEMRKLLD